MTSNFFVVTKSFELTRTWYMPDSKLLMFSSKVVGHPSYICHSNTWSTRDPSMVKIWTLAVTSSFTVTVSMACVEAGFG